MNPIASVMNNPVGKGHYSETASNIAGASVDVDDVVDNFEVASYEEDGDTYFVGTAELVDEYRGLENFDKLSMEVEADLFPAFHRMFRNMTTAPSHLGGVDADVYGFVATDGENALTHFMGDEEQEQLYDRANQGADVQNRGRVDGELDPDTLMREEASMEERFAQEYLKEFSENVELKDL